jgi:serine protease inhibitor
MKIVVFLVALSLLSCKKEDIQKDPVPIEISEKAQEILRANNQFGFDILKKSFEESGDDNLMISPLSISQALSMTYNGAQGETKTAFENVLHFGGQTTQEVNQASLDLTNALLDVDSKVDINIANSIWYKQGFNVDQDFINSNQTYYNAEVSALDFGNQASKDIINNWVDEKTNNKIEKIVDNINPDDVMFLINAIYFKGSWKTEFDSNDTENKPFYLSDGTSKNVETMQIKNDFSVSYKENYSAIELPYGQGNYSMMILLPNDDSSLTELVSQLNEQSWNDLIQNMSVPMSKRILLPKFKFEYENQLNNELTDLGLGIAFSDFADFTGINKEGGLAISRVKHKTFIEVNEEGTEAAAVTSVVVGVTSAGPGTNVFAIDHPFLFVIKEKYTNAILFMGTVTDPGQTAK